MDPTVQQLRMGSVNTDMPALELVGKDQYTTRFDITVLYRISPGEAHELVKVVGRGIDEIREFVRSKSEKALWGALGNLNTQDFYNVDLREAARAAAKNVLGSELRKTHLELVDILIRSIEYDANLEKLLVKKQLLDQNKALNVEKTLLEAELEKTESIERETEAKVGVIGEEMVQEVENIKADTDASVAQIKADADFESEKVIAEADRARREKISQGDLAKTEAKAKGEKAVNEAYLGLGGQAYITRQMIDSLEFGEIEVNTNQVNPFDVDQLLKMLGFKLEKNPPGAGSGGK